MPQLPLAGLLRNGPPTARLRKYRPRFFCHRQRKAGIPRARGRLCVRPYPPVCALGTSPEGGSKERGRPGRGDGLAPGARSFVAALLRMTEGRTGKGMKKKDRRRPPVVTGHDDRAEERAEARATDGELSAQPAMGGAFSPGERRKKGNSNRAAAGRSSAFAPGGGTERGSEAGAPDGVSGNWS